MLERNRLAIFAVVGDEDKDLIRKEQHYLSKLTGNTLALSFPVHITLRGRFWANKNAVIAKLKSICFNDLCLQLNVLLSYPQYINNDLCWIEVFPGNPGFKTLLDLHRILEVQTKELIELDEVVELHKFSNYRPHITLGWNISHSNWTKYCESRESTLCKVRLEKIMMYQYSEKWPYEQKIIPTCSINIK